MVRDEKADASDLRLSDREAKEILERASRIEAAGDLTSLSVTELHEIAQQAGIPSEALSKAIEEATRVSAKGKDSRQGWLHHREISVVRGQISDEDLAWLTRLLDQLGQIEGTVQYQEGVYRWRSRSGFDIEVLNRPTEAQLSVESRQYSSAAKAAVGFAGAGFLAGLLGADGFNSVFPYAMGAVAAGASFGVYWKLRLGRLRKSIGKITKQVAGALTMVDRRCT